jgi:hypothetical protein
MVRGSWYPPLRLELSEWLLLTDARLYTAMLDIHRSSLETRDRDDALRVCTMFSGIAAAGLPNPFYNVKNTRGEIVKSKHLSSLFRAGVKQLYDAIMSSAVPKSVGGGSLSGPQIVALMQAWVRAINRAASFPNTDSDMLLQLVNQEAIQVAVHTFGARSSNLSALIPTSPDRMLMEVRLCLAVDGRLCLGCVVAYLSGCWAAGAPRHNGGTRVQARCFW